jgi:hypothetical protein
MTSYRVQAGVMALLALLLTACASRGTVQDSGPDLAAEPTPDLAPDLAPGEPIAAEPVEPLPTGPLNAKQITNALKERSFKYVAGSRKGTITYFADGTTSYKETGKGEGTGLWQASDGKLCEARNPTSFLPKGTPSTCSSFSANGSSFTAGSTKLTPA